MFFSIIIPNYNNGRYLDKMFTSIYNQTFKDYEIIFVDDVSTDESLIIAEKWKSNFNHMKIIKLNEKRWNGGARNVGLDNRCDSCYTLFIDSDDCFDNNNVFQEIYNLAVDNVYPDCISLSYNWDGDEFRFVELNRDTIEKLTNDCNVACWTKCVMSKLLVKFPENTLMEDVIQHLSQMDIINSVVSYLKPAISWNRKNLYSCSTNKDIQHGKWQSSLFRYYADLYDLQLIKDCTKYQRETRLKDVENQIIDSFR